MNRDYHFSQSEEKRTAEEKLRGQGEKRGAARPGDKLGSEKKTIAANGISPIIVIIVAFFFFFVGRWFKF
jgi:hypothetical protein